MLDAATKRRIDTAHDILVGEVPDPKSQVEQITIALIYKFMDDIDAASEELGGQRTFFVGDFARYGWPQLVRAGLGGHETLNLYAEAITRMPENPGIPPLFRDIFNNAYLPYRDPETLRAFLKVIDEFTYDHSERLGDAFEYLLSVLGSHGDARQFRTPRHIIDFIVSVIDPKKDEKILDPACGTAGFLISSYKHILKANTDDEGNSTLTPDEKGTLAANFKGYDISPDMVRLSLVNLYLHGFVEPHIAEYDTLTSEERWNEYADVILANPPFMSPKGGIRPHRRFSVQSKRSEVLFVDYIAEHLTPTGRAGIIVPEGIIFQSQTAHKQLRKMLVENYLVAVISLPAGVFQPYSGVKTSILLLDRALAQKTDCVAFFKVENDGFDLGAQRRESAENDLPQVKEELGEYLERLRAGESVPSDGVAEPGEDYTTTLGLIAGKEKIAVGGEYNLSREWYRENEHSEHSFPLVSLGDSELFCIESGGTPKSSAEEYWDGGIPWATLADLPPTELVTEIRTTQRTISEIGLAKSSAKLIPENSVIVSTRATIGRIGINRIPLATNQGFKNIIIKNPLRVIPEYIALAMTNLVPTMNAWASSGTLKEISKSKFCELKIPLPPLEIQREIVANIEGYQQRIGEARAGIAFSRSTISSYRKEQGQMSDTKAFMSYSWDDDPHKEWVAKLATKLREDGVETILDQWHAVPGDQLPEFMERHIRENDYVLIVCTPNYRLRSDGREGGVGYEGDIMTAEVYSRRNHRKFIPILARGTWEDAAPSQLKGKYYIDLSSPDKYEENYPDLITTLLGERPIAPPLRRSSQTSSKPQTKESSPSDPLKIVGVIVDEVTEPTMDGTPGSALYTVPFRLSRQPSSLWSEIFVSTWNAPPRFSTMHRPGIARVVGSKIILDGTTIDEVKKYHRKTLILCISKTNEEEARILESRRQDEERQREKAEKHRATVEDIADELNFD